MAALRHVPLARTIQFRALTIACSSSSIETPARVALPPVKNSKSDTRRVLLGMSEMDLQQIAVELGQVSFKLKINSALGVSSAWYMSFFILIYIRKSIGASNCIICCTRGRLENFRILVRVSTCLYFSP